MESTESRLQAPGLSGEPRPLEGACKASCSSGLLLAQGMSSNLEVLESPHHVLAGLGLNLRHAKGVGVILPIPSDTCKSLVLFLTMSLPFLS